MARRKRHEISRAGIELTPEATDAMAEEIEEKGFDLSRAHVRVLKQPAVNPQRPLERLSMHLHDWCDAARWKLEDGVQALGRFARKTLHRNVKV
jgi:hypothetical protein